MIRFYIFSRIISSNFPYFLMMQSITWSKLVLSSTNVTFVCLPSMPVDKFKLFITLDSKHFFHRCSILSLLSFDSQSENIYLIFSYFMSINTAITIYSEKEIKLSLFESIISIRNDFFEKKLSWMNFNFSLLSLWYD